MVVMGVVIALFVLAIVSPWIFPNKMVSKNGVEVKELGDGLMMLTVEGQGIVSHGQHGVLTTEAKHVIKYNQIELNPVTQQLQKAFD